MPKYSVILAAAGQSSRFKDPAYKKPFAILQGKAIWLYSAELFLKRDDVQQLIVVVAADDEEEFTTRFGANLAVMGIDVAIGGKTRADSIEQGLRKVRSDSDFVVVHDAARPCLDDQLVERVFSAANSAGAAIPAIAVTSTLKRSRNGRQIDETVDRNGLYAAQTPQVFRRELLLRLFENRGDFQPTDEAQLAEKAGEPVTLVEGSPLNIKITTKRDMRFAQACLGVKPAPRFDAPPHPFAGDNLWR